MACTLPASPPAYVINEITVNDEPGYKKDFLPGAQKAIDDANTSLRIQQDLCDNWPASSGARRHCSVRKTSTKRGRRGETRHAMRKRRLAASTQASVLLRWKASHNAERLQTQSIPRGR